jgi:acyl-CoA thioester hydrolase
MIDGMLEHKVDIRVRYAETDRMGIVHHAHYWVWCEVARIALMDFMGYPYSQLEAEGFFLPVVELQAQYRVSAYFDDLLTVWATIQEIPRSRIKILYRIERQDQRLFDGSSRHAFVKKGKGACCPPKTWIKVLTQHLK